MSNIYIPRHRVEELLGNLGLKKNVIPSCVDDLCDETHKESLYTWAGKLQENSPSRHRIQLIKLIRQACNCGLRDARDCLDDLCTYPPKRSPEEWATFLSERPGPPESPAPEPPKEEPPKEEPKSGYSYPGRKRQSPAKVIFASLGQIRNLLELLEEGRHFGCITALANLTSGAIDDFEREDYNRPDHPGIWMSTQDIRELSQLITEGWLAAGKKILSLLLDDVDSYNNQPSYREDDSQQDDDSIPF